MTFIELENVFRLHMRTEQTRLVTVWRTPEITLGTITDKSLTAV